MGGSESLSVGAKKGGLARLVPGVRTRTQAREAIWGYTFIAPWILGLIIFVGGPIIVSALLSFADYNLLKTPEYIGLGNFRLAFRGDRLFWPSLGRTFYYSFIYVPIAVIGSLLLAVLLNQKVGGTNFFRTLFFLPHLTPEVALAVLWLWLLHPQLGPVNQILGALHLPKPGWLNDPNWAMNSIILIGLWGGLGGNRMLIYLAGLQGVPQELYEASEIDGAGRWAKFRHVTLPMISPTILFNAILGIIGALQTFSTAYVTTEGGPAYATWFLSLHIYQQAFRYYRLGYGSMLAWFMAVILVAFTYMQLKSSERWVHYAAG